MSSSPEPVVENRLAKGDQTAGSGRPSRGGFCHLHVHTHYSALDGACKVEDLVTEVNKATHSAAAGKTPGGSDMMRFGAAPTAGRITDELCAV